MNKELVARAPHDLAMLARLETQMLEQFKATAKARPQPTGAEMQVLKGQISGTVHRVKVESSARPIFLDGAGQANEWTFVGAAYGFSEVVLRLYQWESGHLTFEPKMVASGAEALCTDGNDNLANFVIGALIEGVLHGPFFKLPGESA